MTPEDAARLASAALRAQHDMGLLLVAGVPDERPYLSGDGEYVDAANAGAAGHNVCRAEVLARVVEPPADE